MSVSVLLVQLPVQEPDAFSVKANVPLAAGCLAAYAANRLGGDVRIAIAPREIVNEGGDEGIIRWISDGGWDVVGFTLYLWNLERSVHIACELKRRVPGILTVAGGPETAEAAEPVVRESFPGMDSVVLGEGEAGFVRLLGDFLATGTAKPLYAESPLLSLDEAPNPYLAGTIPVLPGDPVYFETMRGCPCRCTYCFYGKAMGGIRSFPKAAAGDVFALARAARASEIYLMDPSFNATGNLDARLRALAAINRPALPLHTELRLESVTRDRARLLEDAGFASVEVGLQSARPEVLRRVKRPFDRDKFVRGAELLSGTGIEVRTGVILGLPGDDLDGFLETLRFAADLGLEPGLEIYPLAVLPGTELRRSAASLGLSYMPRPPYWVLETPTLPQEEVFAALTEAEDLLGIEYFRPIPPRFASSRGGWTSFADLGDPRAFRALREAPERIASDLTLLVPGAMLRKTAALRDLEALGRLLLEKNPFTLFKLVAEEDGGPLPPAAESIQEAFFNPAHPVNRGRYFQVDAQRRFSSRLYHLTGNAELAARLYGGKGASRKDGIAADLVLRYREENEGKAEFKRLLRTRPFVLLDESAVSEHGRSRIEKLYRDHPGLLLRTGGTVAAKRR